MKILDPGHRYVLENYDNAESCSSNIITFMKRIGDRYPGNTAPFYGGTNIQEVARVLIDRLKYLDKQIPCAETKAAIEFARDIIMQLEIRAKRVKGKPFPWEIMVSPLIEGYETCKVCGHILCEEH